MRFPVRSVLCATDLSPVGDGAVALAYALAGPAGKVHLLTVEVPPVLVNPLDASAVYVHPPSAERLAVLERDVRGHLEMLVPVAAAARTEVHVVHDSSPVVAIVRVAQEVAADLIVLGTHGRGGLKRALLGSVAAAVTKRATAPVVLFHAVDGSRR